MDVNRPILRRSNNELGNVALFVAVVLPVALTFTILLIDVTAYQSHRALAQQRIDSIVSKATKLLPNTVAARTFINSELERFDSFAANTTARGGGIEVDSTGIGLRVAGSYKASFSSFLPRVNGEPLSFYYSQVSKSKIVPINTVLVIADGNTLRPPAHTAWGNVQTWPLAEYWKFVTDPNSDDMGEVEEPLFWRDWNKEWESELFRRWATQHCFNPVLSSVKLAAIGLVDVLGARTDSRLGVVHTPGDGEGKGFFVTRDLAFPSVEARGPEAKWSGYFEFESRTGDEFCSFISSLAMEL